MIVYFLPKINCSVDLSELNVTVDKCKHSPVMCGGSMVFGPKNDGISLDVVTGVLRSPVCASDIECDWCSVLEIRSI